MSDHGRNLSRAGQGSQVQTGVGAPSPVEREAPYLRPGMGRTPSTISDRRDPNAHLVTGGRIDELFDESWFVQPMASSVRVKREGPLLRIAVPGDRGEFFFDKVTGDDGEEYWACLDGSAPFFPGAPDEYHPDVGTSMGTILMPPEPFPFLNARELGEQQINGDVSILAPIIWHKRRHAAGHGVGQGGVVLKRKREPDPDTGELPPLPTPAEAANDRHVSRTVLEELEIEIIGGTTEQIPIVEGPGWTPAVIFWHEQLQLDPDGNNLLGATGPSFPLGDVTHDNVVEWLDFNPGQLTFSGDDCALEPLTPLVRVNLRRLSYMCGIAANTEIAERLAEQILIVDENARRAHRVAVGASRCACQIRDAFIKDSDFAAEFPSVIMKLAEVACPCGCGKVKPKDEPVITPDPSDPLGGPGGGGGSGGSGGGSGGAPALGGSGGAPPTTTGTGGAPTPPGSIAGSSGPATGGGWWTRYTTPTGTIGFHYTPPGGTPPAAGTTIGGSMPSDRRLKTRLRQVGTAGDWTLWSWTWSDEAVRLGLGDQPTTGLIAQEVQETRPDAVRVGEHGFLEIDYDALWSARV